MSKTSMETLVIFVGYKCNYSCQACSASSDTIRHANYDPSPEEIIKSLPILAEKFNITRMISIQGGETFMYWDTAVMLVKKISEYFPTVPIDISTNGQLIGGNIDQIFELINQTKHIRFTISGHLNDLTTKIGQQWKASVDTLLNHPQIIKLHNHHYHVKDNINANIYFQDIPYWSSHYTTTSNGLIKPHATKNSTASFERACTGHHCTYLFGSKLYKCGRLGTLHELLKDKNQLNDLDWRPYLDYQPVDLFDIDENNLNNFITTYGKPISVCDMCKGSMPWKERTYEMIFTHKTNNK